MALLIGIPDSMFAGTADIFITKRKRNQPIPKHQFNFKFNTMTMTTYIRKYYLHRQIKRAGFSLHLEKCHKTINVLPEQVIEAKENKYLAELQRRYNYGLQILNPMINE